MKHAVYEHWRRAHPLSVSTSFAQLHFKGLREKVLPQGPTAAHSSRHRAMLPFQITQ